MQLEMGAETNPANREPDDSPSGDECVISIRQFAHELNSLLDGVMRHLRLVALAEEGSATGEDHSQFEAAQNGLARMAAG